MLGDLGTVLPRIEHGSADRPAQGWYAEINGDGEVFLGDYSMLAGSRIEALKREHA
jgi:hypothetical protein